MPKFRKKPVVVEAVQLLWPNWNEVCEIVGADAFTKGAVGVYVDQDGVETTDTNARLGIRIPTLEGVMLGVEGDWIIKGIKGEVYPCKPDIFAMTYEPVE